MIFLGATVLGGQKAGTIKMVQVWNVGTVNS